MSETIFGSHFLSQLDSPPKVEFKWRLLTLAKYIYLMFFFGLLSAMLYPFIYGTKNANVIFGMGVLYLGLAGMIMLHKGATSEKRQLLYMIVGFSMIGLSLNWIWILTGRM